MQKGSVLHFREMAGAVLRAGAQLSFRASGRSMSPFIHDNETVIVGPPSNRLRIGDVILFGSSGQQLTLHRIVRKTENGYVTRGDSACHEDGAVRHNEVLGRAVRVVGGLNFHLRFPLSTLVVLALRIREWPALFGILKVPGRFLLLSLQRSGRGRSRTSRRD